MEPTQTLARRFWAAIEPIHATVYFAPEPAEAAKKAGLRGFWMSYFASRVAPLGPVPAEAVGQAPAGWQAAFAKLGLAAHGHVLVIPDLYDPMRWQAETGVPGSMVGGGDFIEPNETGQATSYIYNRLSTVEYLTTLWQGSGRERAPSPSQIRQDLAYWRLSAIVTVTGRNSRLARFLTREFGPPAVQVGDVLAWRLRSGQPPPGKLSARRRDMWPDG